MPKILKTSGQEIDRALRNVTRQYLVGDLQKPQALRHVPSSLIEIGITRYENEVKLEPPHRNKQAFEFQYMTAGLTAYPKEAASVPLSSAVELPLAESQRRRLKDVIGVSEAAADVFEVAPMSPRNSAHCCSF